jgi:hypothetical protein
MALFYGKHKVQNYDSWRPFFDADQPRLLAIGAKTVNIMRSADDPNEVHFIFDIPNPQAFFETMASPELAQVMQKAGVMEQPSVYQLQEMHP